MLSPLVGPEFNSTSLLSMSKFVKKINTINFDRRHSSLAILMVPIYVLLVLICYGFWGVNR